MKMILSGLILMWNSILANLARAVGLFFGGIVVGFMKGIQDQREMRQYIKYQQHMLKKEMEDDSDDGK